MELEIAPIKTNEDTRVIYIDRYDDEFAWLSIQVSGGGASVTMTLDQAKRVIAGLTTVVEAMEAA
jgi:hypothetical protein